jgi:hypothetical protein
MRNFAYPVLGNPLYRPDALWNFHSVNSEFDVISKKPTVKTTGGLTRDYSNYGSGVVVSGNSNFDRYVLQCGTNVDNIGADNFTALITFELLSLTGYGGIGRRSGGDPSITDWVLMPGAGTNNAFFNVNVGATQYICELGKTWALNTIYTLIGRRTGTTIDVYVYDHSLRQTISATATNAGITTVNYTGAEKLRLAEIDSSLASNSNILTYNAALFKRALNDFEINELLVNPTLLFQYDDSQQIPYDSTKYLLSNPVNFNVSIPESNVTVTRVLDADPVNFNITVFIANIEIPQQTYTWSLHTDPVHFYITAQTGNVTDEHTLSANAVNFRVTSIGGSAEMSFVIFNGTGTVDNFTMD